MHRIINRRRLRALFGDMVDIYSPSGKEEEIVAFLADSLGSAGLPVRLGDVDGERRNLLVTSGSEPPTVLFLGHIDTVPAFDIEQYGFAAGNNWCSGLGTADMKGGCAAMIEAFLAASRNDCLPACALLALVVGEEETGDGTRALLETYDFEDALVAEPTDLVPCLEHYGYVEMVVSAFGHRRHAAMSSRETNAIRALLRFLLQLEEYVENRYPQAVLNIRDLHSSESGFAVPDRCTAAVDLHILPNTSARECAAMLRNFADSQMTGSVASRHAIEFPTLDDGYRISAEHRLPRLLRATLQAQSRPWAPRSFQSHSDANLLRSAGCRPVIFGPGQLAKAHAVDEGVDFEQVVCAAQIYFELLRNLAVA